MDNPYLGMTTQKRWDAVKTGAINFEEIGFFLLQDPKLLAKSNILFINCYRLLDKVYSIYFKRNFSGRIDFVYKPEEAARLVTQHSYDMVITRFGCARLETFIEKIRQAGYDKMIIAYTGMLNQDALALTSELKLDGYVRKPLHDIDAFIKLLKGI